MTGSTEIPLTGNRAGCVTCGEVFSGDSNFDRHWVGRFDVEASHPEARRCLTRDEMIARRFVLDDAGVWRSPGSSGRLHRAPIPTAPVEQESKEVA
jgi:hypothetical protein